MQSEHLRAAGGVVAVLAWLFTLAYASSPRGQVRSVADYLRDTIVVSIVIVATLGAVHALYAPVLWVVALGVAAARFARRSTDSRGVALFDRSDAIACVVALPFVMAIAWPQLVRPITDGDSLLYHLPNAAAWVDTGSIWTAGTLYWWYPPGSELVASAILAIGGVAALPIAGLAGYVLLVLRLCAFARRCDIAPVPSGLIAAAVATVPVIAIQAGTLQNDVWLAAWVLEIVWACVADRTAMVRAAAVCAVVKPVGFVAAFVALAWMGAPALAGAIAFAPLLLWFGRDALLLSSALTSPLFASTPHPFATSIAGQGMAGLPAVAKEIIAQGIGLVALVGVALLAIVRRDAFRLTGLAATLFLCFLIAPFAYRSDVAQLTNGASLRLLIPALMAGTVAALPFLRRGQIAISILCGAVAIFNIDAVLAIFWNDASVHGAISMAMFAAVCIAAALWLRRALATAAVFVLLIGTVAWNASTEPARYYDAQISSRGLFAWLASVRPASVVTVQLRAGRVIVVSPDTTVSDALDRTCDTARTRRAWLIVADEFAPNVRAFAQRRSGARTCGRILYEDAAAIVVDPWGETLHRPGQGASVGDRRLGLIHR